MADWTQRTWGTPGYRALSEAARVSADGDLWGWAQGWRFATAHVLHHMAPELLPANWDYRDSPLCPDGPAEWQQRSMSYEEELIMTEFLFGLTPEDLVTFGAVVNRYAEWVRRAGRDY